MISKQFATRRRLQQISLGVVQCCGICGGLLLDARLRSWSRSGSGVHLRWSALERQTQELEPLRVRRPFAVVRSWTLDSKAGHMFTVIKKKKSISEASFSIILRVLACVICFSQRSYCQRCTRLDLSALKEFVLFRNDDVSSYYSMRNDAALLK